MSIKKCKVCGLPLNESQWSKDKEYKSCPKCSTKNGEEHIYYKYPENFGITPKRASTNYPEGPQSYCVPCRGNSIPEAKKVLCSELK